eukprot:Skav213337  [mRNA]  locus=scaffold3340:396443:397756:+ [translate_table: standard]
MITILTAVAGATGARSIVKDLAEPILDTCAVCLEQKEEAKSAAPNSPNESGILSSSWVRMENADPEIAKWFRDPDRQRKRGRYSYSGYPATVRLGDAATVR